MSHILNHTALFFRGLLFAVMLAIGVAPAGATGAARVIQQPVKLSGVVSDDFGDPVSGATVKLTCGNISFSGRSDGQGRYSIEVNRVRTEFTLTAEATGFLSYTSPQKYVFSADIPDTQAPIALSRESCSLTVKVTDDAGTSLAGATVTAAGVTASTDQTGTATLSIATNLCTESKPVAIAVGCESYGSAETTVTFATYTRSATVKLSKQMCQLSVTVADASGAALSNATVAVGSITALTNAQGTAQLTLAYDTTHGQKVTVAASKFGYVAAQAEADFTQSNSTSINMVLSAATATVDIAVADPESNPIEGAAVTLGTDTRLSDATGHAKFSLSGPDVAGRTLNYTVSRLGYGAVQNTVSFTQSIELSPTVTLAPLAATVTFHLLDIDEVPVDQAIITMQGKTGVTDATGCATLTFNGPDVAGKKVAYTISWAQSNAYQGEVDFTTTITPETVEIVFDESAVGLDTVYMTTPLPTATAVYNLHGVRVNATIAGQIYIIDGHKVRVNTD